MGYRSIQEKMSLEACRVIMGSGGKLCMMVHLRAFLFVIIAAKPGTLMEESTMFRVTVILSSILFDELSVFITAGRYHFRGFLNIPF